MDYGILIVERTGAVATIRLNRPEKHNALNTRLCHELIDALDKLEAVPIDRWVRRAFEEWYLDEEQLSYDALLSWARQTFGPYAGYAQQYLFYRRRQGQG